jgi:hypothetical protein
MDGTLGRLEQVVGAGLFAAVLLDVFLTVLYARMGSSIIAGPLARLAWRVFRAVSAPFGRRRGVVLSFCGPAVLALLVTAWSLGLTLGAALVIHPALGSGIRSANGGESPTDFVAALDAAGNSLSVVGSGEFAPRTTAYRLLYLFNSLVGMSILSLTLTYLMQVYSALRERNVLGLKLHLATGETGDAAELLARIGPRGEFDTGLLSETAAELAAAKEGHHFYPVLFYFRFDTPIYSVSRVCLVALDAVTLIRTALADRYAAVRQSAAVEQVERAAMKLLESLDRNFLDVTMPDPPAEPDPETRHRWVRRYAAAVRRLREAGVETADEAAGAERYVALRARWDRYIRALAPAMAYRPREIDPAGVDPDPTGHRPAIPARAVPREV